MGHARALISLGDPKLQVKIFEEIQEHGYSVRKVEEIVKSLSEGEAVKSRHTENNTQTVANFLKNSTY